MSSTGLARQYDQLTTRERMRLVVEAQARRDKGEVERLWQTCPRKTYSQVDAAFEGAYESLQTIALESTIELTYLLGHLRMLDQFIELATPFIAVAGANDGIAAADAEDGRPPDAEPPAEQAEAPPQNPEDEDERAYNLYKERFTNAQQVADEFRHAFRLRFGGNASALLAGLDRFTQRVLGVDAKTYLRAWQATTVKVIESFEVEAIEPAPKRVDEWERDIFAQWRNLMKL